MYGPRSSSARARALFNSEMRFLDFNEFERLVEAAAVVDGNTHLIVLLGGEAGLRCGDHGAGVG